MAGRKFSKSNFMVWLGVFILLFGTLATCTQQPPTPDASQVATLVAVTLTAMPTATAVPLEIIVTPASQPSVLLDRNDFQSVLRWVVFSLSHKRLEMLAEVIGEHGVKPFTPYRGRELKGNDLADFMIQELRNAVKNSTPRCAGYHSGSTSQFEESVIYFYGVEPNWSDLLGNSRVVSAATAFRFFHLEQGWEVVDIYPVRPEIWPNLEETLSACP